MQAQTQPQIHRKYNLMGFDTIKINLVCGIMTLQSQNRIFTYKSVIFGLGNSCSPIDPTTILQNNLSFHVSKITLYDIFDAFGLQILSYYVHGILWTKLAPA